MIREKIRKIMIDYLDEEGNITNDPRDRAKQALQRLKAKAGMSDTEFSLMLAEVKLAKRRFF